MIITYLRSSSFNTYDWCEHKYFIEYVLGYQSPPNKKADMGNVVHKVMELFALYKLALDSNLNYVQSHDFGKLDSDWFTDSQRLTDLTRLAYTLYLPDDKYSELDTCVEWSKKILDSAYNPTKLNIVEPEKFFDINIEKEWAKYAYRLPNEELLEGYLALKGTIDLVVKINDDTVELCDYKTGSQKNWNTGAKKTYEKLLEDFQIELYYYCASKLYPDKNVIFTINYINYDGPLSVVFPKEKLGEIEDRLMKVFQSIKHNLRPQLNVRWDKYRTNCNWCEWNQKIVDGKTLCKNIKEDVYTIGLSKTMEKWTTDKSYKNLSTYGDGGGRKRDE